MPDPADTAADESSKARSKSVSLPPALWTEIEEHAAKHYGGNRSAYLRELYERDKAGRSQRVSAISKTVIEDLARIYLPTRADQLADELVRGSRNDPNATINQPVVIENFLAALLRALRETTFEPEAPFELADKARVKGWEAESKARLDALAALIDDRLGNPDSLSFLAEPEAPIYAKRPAPPRKRPPPPVATG